MADQTRNWLNATTSLPPNRRYICTHDSTGKSVVHSSPAQIFHGREGIGGVARSYSTSTVPAKLKDDEDIAAYMNPEGPTSHKATNIVGTGSNLVVCDLAPGHSSYMHRTVSIDYSICVIGHIRMELDSGETIDLKPGDHVVQRGTMHKWCNASQTEPARFVAVTLPCEPMEIPGTGKMLEEEHIFSTNGPTKTDDSKL